MKTILTRTAIAALAVASLGFAACSAGVEAKPQDAPGNTGSQQVPAQTNSPAPQQTESGSKSSEESKTGSSGVTAPGVTVGPGGISAPGVTVGPGGISAPGVSVGPGGVTASAGGITSGAGNFRSADCDEDPVVKETGAVVRFSGHCESIVIKGSGAAVEYDWVDKLVIEGTGVAVRAGERS